MHRQVLLFVSLTCAIGASGAQAQVVQLPTFSSFSISTTVSVPDSGAGFVGGVSRGSWGSRSRGVPGFSNAPGASRLFTNRSSGSSVSSSGAYATAPITDHAERDRLLLDGAAARRGELGFASETDRRAAYLSEFVARSPKTSPDEPIATRREDASDAAARLAAANAEHEAKMAEYIKRAESAELAGRLGAARCCYDVLIRRGSAAQKRFAEQRLAALDAPLADDKLASRED